MATTHLANSQGKGWPPAGYSVWVWYGIFLLIFTCFNLFVFANIHDRGIPREMVVSGMEADLTSGAYSIGHIGVFWIIAFKPFFLESFYFNVSCLAPISLPNTIKAYFLSVNFVIFIETHGKLLKERIEQ
jgi:hypothetical protein